MIGFFRSTRVFYRADIIVDRRLYQVSPIRTANYFLPLLGRDAEIGKATLCFGYSHYLGNNVCSIVRKVGELRNSFKTTEKMQSVFRLTMRSLRHKSIPDKIRSDDFQIYLRTLKVISGFFG